MKKSIGLIFLVFVCLTVLLSGCAAPTPEPTATALPPTFTPEPTATSTPIPPSPTPTELPGPTPSGKYEFFDVSINQESKDTVRVSFGYQIEQGVDLNGLKIMAQATTKGAQCNTNKFSVFSKPYDVTEVVSIVEGDNAVSISMTESGKCSFKGFSLSAFRVEGTSAVFLYQQEFEMPFELEK